MRSTILMTLLVLGAAQAEAQTAKQHYTDGKQHQKAKRYAEAVKAFDRALELDPKFHRVFPWRGDCKLKLKDAQGAVADFNAALRNKIQTGWVYRRRGLALWRLKRVGPAEADFGRAIAKGDLQSHYVRATLRLRRRNPIGAVHDLETLLAKKPKHPRAKKARALIEKHKTWDKETQNKVDHFQGMLATDLNRQAMRLVREAHRAYTTKPRNPKLGAWLLGVALEHALHPKGKVREAVLFWTPRAGRDSWGIRLTEEQAVAFAPRLRPLLSVQALDSWWVVRIAALAGLQYSKTPAGVALVRDRLERDSSFKVRSSAAYRLGKMGDSARSAAPALLDAMNRNHPQLRNSSIDALAAIGRPLPKGTIGAIRAFLTDRRADPAAREHAAFAVAKLKVAEALPEVVALLEEPPTAVRKGPKLNRVRVMRCLEHFGELAVPRIEWLMKRWIENPAAKRELRSEAADMLAEILPHTTPTESLAKRLLVLEGKVGVWDALGATAHPDAVALLHKRLREQKKVTDTHSVVYALGRAGPAAASVVPDLRKWLGKFEVDTGSWSIKSYFWCFPRLGPAAKAAIPDLKRFLTDRWKRSAQQTIDALEKLPDE